MSYNFLKRNVFNLILKRLTSEQAWISNFPLRLRRSLLQKCALVKTLFHWLSIILQQSKSLLIGSCNLVHWSWTTRSEWRFMASLLSREPVCWKEDCSPFDIGTVYRVIASFTNAEKSFGLLKESGSQIYWSSSPRRKKPVESSASFDRNGSWNILGLFIPSTWMVRSVCLVSVLEWSVAKMVPN